MTLPQRSDSPEPALVSDPIVPLVLLCQQHYHLWVAAPDEPLRASRSIEYSQSLERLWFVLADDLRRVARGWIHSNMAPDIESLAMNLFANIVVHLPKLHIDPARHVRNLLLMVARRGQIDEYRRVYASTPQRQPTPSDQPDDTQLWQSPGRRTQAGAPLDMQHEIVDPTSADIEERMIDQIDQQAILENVWNDYWPHKLSSTDFLIMELRWRMEPPSSFREIAERMGGGWSEEAVRQRHYRIIVATREYLRGRGLID